MRPPAPAVLFSLAAMLGTWSAGSGHAGVVFFAASQQKQAATAFIKFTTDPANAALLRKGFEPPAR